MDEFDIDGVMERCLEISNRLTLNTDYVPISSLLKEFQVEILVRPLLVEAIIGQRPTGENEFALTMLLNRTQWNFTQSQIETDNQKKQLPVRLRNTIAHELAHTLEFKKTKDGYKDLNGPKAKKKEVLRITEDRTEQFSKLLLVSDNAVKRFLDSISQQIEISDLMKFKSRLGVSREVIVSRLKLLWKYSVADIYQHPALNNLAIGVGRYQDGSILLRRGRFAFAKFEENIFPDFLQTLSQRPENKDGAYKSPQQLNISCWPSGRFGDNQVTFELPWGTHQTPGILKKMVQISVEPAPLSGSSAFLYIVRKEDMY